MQAHTTMPKMGPFAPTCLQGPHHTYTYNSLTLSLHLQVGCFGQDAICRGTHVNAKFEARTVQEEAALGVRRFPGPWVMPFCGRLCGFQLGNLCPES